MTVQPDRKNHAHCFRCNFQLPIKEARLQSLTANDVGAGTRHTGSYYHAHCINAILPVARSFTGFPGLEADEKQALIKAVQDDNE